MPGRVGGRPARRQRGPARGYDLETEVEVSLVEVLEGCEREIPFKRLEVCGVCKGSGAKPGTQPVTCRQCGGRGEVSFQQGFFAISRPCPTCSGAGQTIPDPCTTCRGSGSVRKTSQIAIKIPAGVDTGQRLKLTNEGEAGERGGRGPGGGKWRTVVQNRF